MADSALISDPKAELELEKLREEIRVLRKPPWKDPKLVGAVIAFIVSFGFNVTQYFNAKADAERKNAELELKETQWNTQRVKLDLEVSDLKQKLAKGTIGLEQIGDVRSELAKVKKNISVYEGALTEAELQLPLLQSQISQYQVY